MKTVSVVTSAYNEEDSIEELARRLRAVFDELSGYQFEAIVVENGSVDGTFDKLRRIHQEDPRFKIVRLSRNFRMDGGVTAVLTFCHGRRSDNYDRCAQGTARDDQRLH